MRSRRSRMATTKTSLLGVGGASSMNISTTPILYTTPAPTDDLDATMEKESPTEAGAIAGAVFGILVCLIILAVAAFMYRKHKREREEVRRAKRSQMSSMMNAGVYMDTTTTDSLVPSHTVEVPHPNPRNSAYKSLTTQPDNMYEQDSDEEI